MKNTSSYCFSKKKLKALAPKLSDDYSCKRLDEESEYVGSVLFEKIDAIKKQPEKKEIFYLLIIQSFGIELIDDLHEKNRFLFSIIRRFVTQIRNVMALDLNKCI